MSISTESVPGLWSRARSASLVPSGPEWLDLHTCLQSRQPVLFTRRLFDPDNDTLAAAVGGRDCLVVTTPTVDRLYGRRIRSCFDGCPSGRGCQYLVLACREATKTMQAAQHIVERAGAMQLGRRSPIVAIGGGVCLDICGFAAAIYRRGVPHIKVPTTLLGLVDAGIGIKNGLNVGSRKSIVGAFHPPEFSLIAPDVLATLDPRHLRCGMAECLKMAIVCDAELFAMIEQHGATLVCGGSEPAEAGRAIIRRAVSDMLEQLAGNPFERESLERAVDFGHSFSPAIESASGYAVQHGEAVAIDMAISVLLARNLSILSPAEADRVVTAIRGLGLPVFPADVSAAGLWDFLLGIVAHRDGRLRLPVPDRIGSCVFLGDRDDIGGIRALQAVLDELRAMS